MDILGGWLQARENMLVRAVGRRDNILPPLPVLPIGANIWLSLELFWQLLPFFQRTMAILGYCCRKLVM